MATRLSSRADSIAGLFTPNNFFILTGDCYLSLFRKHYPRLTVFRDTVTESGDTIGLSILASCCVCSRSFNIGEKLYTLPCSASHFAHVSCLNRAFETEDGVIRAQIPGSAVSLGDVISAPCPVCDQEIPLYEHLLPNERARCRVALGKVPEIDLPIQFAALSKDEWSIIGQPQFLPVPWGNLRRYITADHIQYEDHRPVVPRYCLEQTLTSNNPENPTDAICLRTNRERLCELPCLAFLHQRLRDDQSLPPDAQSLRRRMLFRLYLVTDIVNAICVRDTTFIHLYIQARVNCGGVAWFGFREYRDYILGLEGFHPPISWIEFHEELDDFAQAHNAPGLIHLSNLNRMGVEIKKFDRQALRLLRIQRNQNTANPDIAVKMQELQAARTHELSQGFETWRLENQTIRRPE
ncbi:hypothetical protein TWF788_000134 [Orbilia oligospora]|uniref:Uncharacterized protein n=1 Tax=Orbilia oligospora TaxID=2813651 RepID=A0A7C8UFR7_ORBOL|nr:hypothetical protein TWF788_000134 [Orbilia oligospora]